MATTGFLSAVVVAAARWRDPRRGRSSSSLVRFAAGPAALAQIAAAAAGPRRDRAVRHRRALLPDPVLDGLGRCPADRGDDGRPGERPTTSSSTAAFARRTTRCCRATASPRPLAGDQAVPRDREPDDPRRRGDRHARRPARGRRRSTSSASSTTRSRRSPPSSSRPSSCSRAHSSASSPSRWSRPCTASSGRRTWDERAAPGIAPRRDSRRDAAGAHHHDHDHGHRGSRRHRRRSSPPSAPRPQDRRQVAGATAAHVLVRDHRQAERRRRGLHVVPGAHVLRTASPSRRPRSPSGFHVSVVVHRLLGSGHRLVPRLWQRTKVCAGSCSASTLTPVSTPPSPSTATSSCGSRAVDMLNRRGHATRGFTLIELLMSIAILGILMSRVRRPHVRHHDGQPRRRSHVSTGPGPSSSAPSTSDATFRARRDRMVLSQARPPGVAPAAPSWRSAGVSYDAGTLAERITVVSLRVHHDDRRRRRHGRAREAELRSGCLAGADVPAESGNTRTVARGLAPTAPTPVCNPGPCGPTTTSVNLTLSRLGADQPFTLVGTKRTTT